MWWLECGGQVACEGKLPSAYSTLFVVFAMSANLLPIQVQVLVLTHPALYSLGPGYFRDHIAPYIHIRSLCSVGECLLQVPVVVAAVIVKKYIPPFI